VLEILGRILAEGARQGLFRPGLDVRHVYIALAALGYFYLSNRYTLTSFLGTDLMQDAHCDRWLEEMTRVLLASVAANGLAGSADASARQNPASPKRRPKPGKT
jgi:hypothetical protein